MFQGLATIATPASTSAWTNIPLDQELVDRWGGHSDSSQTNLWYAPFTANASDYYLCTGYTPLPATDPAKIALAGLIKNGATSYEGTKIPCGTAHAVDPMVIDLVPLAGGDTIGLRVWTDLSGQSTVVSGKSPSLTARWVGSGTGTVVGLPAVPHTWIDADALSASSTGATARAGGNKVPLNTEIRDLIRFLNYPPLARITNQGGSQSIATGTGWTSVIFTAGSNIDTFAGWASGAPTLYTVPRAGVYFVAGYVSYIEVGGANTGYRAARLLINGATPYGGTSSVPTTTGAAGSAVYAVRKLRLAAGDTIAVQAQQTQGVSLALGNGASTSSRLIAVWLSR
jgi:hypothetical protein